MHCCRHPRNITQNNTLVTTCGNELLQTYSKHYQRQHTSYNMWWWFAADWLAHRNQALLLVLTMFMQIGIFRPGCFSGLLFSELMTNGTMITMKRQQRVRIMQRSSETVNVLLITLAPVPADEHKSTPAATCTTCCSHNCPQHYIMANTSRSILSDSFPCISSLNNRIINRHSIQLYHLVDSLIGDRLIGVRFRRILLCQLQGYRFTQWWSQGQSPQGQGHRYQGQGLDVQGQGYKSRSRPLSRSWRTNTISFSMT